MTTTDPYDLICWSADEPDLPTLLSHVDEMPRLRLIKIDRAFVDEHGWDVFDALRERDLRVFFDTKSIEIPVKLEKLAQIHCKRARPWMLNCMAGGLSTRIYHKSHENDELDGLKRFADVCNDNGVRPCAVTVLTSKKPDTVNDEFNGRSSTTQVLYYAHQLVKAGFSDLVCSPLEARALHNEGYTEVLDLNTPGIRPAGSAIGDQARVDTPSAALSHGTTRLVIGRPITNGPGTIAENLAAIADEILAGVTV